ncbi:hypothetical protein S83_046794 [Arachis hypogaea]
MEDGPTTIVDNLAGISDAFDTVDSGGYSEDVTSEALKQTQENGSMSVEGISLTADDIIQMEFSDPKQAARLYEEYSHVRGFGI